MVAANRNLGKILVRVISTVGGLAEEEGRILRATTTLKATITPRGVIMLKEVIMLKGATEGENLVTVVNHGVAAGAAAVVPTHPNA